ncbi:MAG: hypothetical protein K8F32_06760 [Rhodocyclaceae bacterium]|jgi:hypothetical protein|nr:hypothetical protein [Rhodocyclaceae bacterium]GIK24144.1 MAG: hypothetical protein BroJett006_03900 [Betaproteobacteria bacterium]
MAGYVYRSETLSRLLKSKEPVLRLERQFGPPHDYPQKMLETVRKQLPASRAVYRLECQTRVPQRNGADSVVLRIPARNALFAEVTRIVDERNQSSGVVYFGVDDAVSPTNRLSPNLAIPYEKIDVLFGDKWLPLTAALLDKIPA